MNIKNKWKEVKSTFKCNNSFNERVEKELPRSFSLEDVDGVIRFHYGEWKTRFILYEVKSSIEEPMKSAQFKTLCLLERSIDWSKFDERSGVFIIKGLEDLTWNKTKITRIKNNQKEVIKEEVNFDYYSNWFYDKEITTRIPVNRKLIYRGKCPNSRCDNIVEEYENLPVKCSKCNEL